MKKLGSGLKEIKFVSQEYLYDFTNKDPSLYDFTTDYSNARETIKRSLEGEFLNVINEFLKK